MLTQSAIPKGRRVPGTDRFSLRDHGRTRPEEGGEGRGGLKYEKKKVDVVQEQSQHGKPSIVLRHS